MPDFLRPGTARSRRVPGGLPLDFGTVLEGSQAGASHALDAIRRELRRYHKTYNLEYNVSLAHVQADAGNVNLRHPNHRENHQHIREKLDELCRQYPRVVVLGGSHDGTYSTVRGLFDAAGSQAVGGINYHYHRLPDGRSSYYWVEKQCRNATPSVSGAESFGWTSAHAETPGVAFLHCSIYQLYAWYLPEPVGKRRDDTYRVVG